MFRPALALFAATAMALPVATASAAEIEIQVTNPLVELTISETVKSVPDIAQVSAGVVTRAPSAQEALRQNARQMDSLVKLIRGLGVEGKDIQTSNFNLGPNYTYDRQSGEQTFTGYNVSNQVTVRLRDLDDIGAVLDAMVEAGANNVQGPMFSLENDEEVKAEARAAAFARGLKQAEDYARMAGYSGVRLLEINESLESHGPRPAAMAMRVQADMAESATPIEPGEVGTAVTLGLKYEMVN